MKDTLQKTEGTEGQDTLKELKDEIKKSFLYAAQSKIEVIILLSEYYPIIVPYVKMAFLVGYYYV